MNLTPLDPRCAVAHAAVPNHVEVLARLALRFVQAVPEIEAAYYAEGATLEGFNAAVHIKLKIGINSGPLIGAPGGRCAPRSPSQR